MSDIDDDKSYKAVKKFCKTIDSTVLQDISDNDIEFFYRCSKITMKMKAGHAISHDIARSIINYYDLRSISNTDKWPFPHNDRIDCKKAREILEVQGKNVILKRRAELSISGFKHDILSSGTQKNMRRNNTRNALWTVIEWILFSCADAKDKDIKGEVTNIRKRLMVSYIEDIGPANVDLFTEIDKLIFSINISENPSGKNIIKNIVNIMSKMSQSYHTRICSYVRSLFSIYTDRKKYLSKDHQENLKYFPYVKSVYDYINYNKQEYQKIEEELMKNVSNMRKMINSFTQDVKALDELAKNIKTLKSKYDSILLKLLYKSLSEGNPSAFYYSLTIALRYNYGNQKGRKVFEHELDVTKSGKGINAIFSQIEKIYGEKGMDKKIVEKAKKWYFHIAHREAFLAFFMPMLLLCFNYQKNGSIPGIVDYTPYWQSLTMYNITEPSIDFENDDRNSDIAADIHTSSGKKHGYTKDSYKGVERFVEIGTYVDHEYIAPPASEHKASIPFSDQSIYIYNQLKNYYNFTKILFISGGGYDKAKIYIGILKKYRSDNTINIKEEKEEMSLKKNGEYKEYHDNGQLSMHAFYKDDKKNGEYKKWYSNGQLSRHSFYKDDKKDGEYKTWYDNGQLYIHAFYKDDKKMENTRNGMITDN